MEGIIERGKNYSMHSANEEIIKRLCIHDVAKISDSMARHGSLHNSIKPRKRGMRLYGQAVTVYAPPGAYDTVVKAAKMTGPGYVLVVAAQGFCDAFMADGLVYSILQKNGASGVLVDGAITDTKTAESCKIGIFARAVSPQKILGRVEGAINIPLYCGGMLIAPGDYVVGDDDGTVVIPEEDIWRVIELADDHLRGELERVERTNRGAKLYEMNNSIEKCRNWRG